MLPWLGILFAGSVALGGWFLIGPSLGSAPYYKVGWHRTAYEYSDQVILLCIPWALALFGGPFFAYSLDYRDDSTFRLRQKIVFNNEARVTSLYAARHEPLTVDQRRGRRLPDFRLHAATLEHLAQELGVALDVRKV